MKITDEAEQKVARILFDREWRDGDWRWRDYPQPNRWQLLARQVLEAALPHMTDDGVVTPPVDRESVRREVAEEIAEALDAWDGTSLSPAGCASLARQIGGAS